MTTAWVLPGGASMGAIQVGQAEALVAAGHAPDLLIGTSAGSLNAAWLAADPTPRGVASLRRLWLEVRRNQIFPFRPVAAGLGLLGRRDHLVPNTALTRWLSAHLPYRRLEEARLPITVTATDLDTGDPVYFSSGDAIPALVASCAVPGVFPPVALGGRTLVDGGLAADAPIEVAMEAGADRIFVLPTLGPTPPGRPRGAGDVLLRSVNLMLGNARDSEIGPWADRVDIFVVPAPWVPGVSPFSFSHGLQLMTEARARTEAWLPAARPVAPGETGRSATTARRPPLD
ncbi:patatin-like phospholipase family protein [Acidiferrimicrobium sp. IK]|uniref:patatin-like phospholipase family protein n=1 Tax=Acidiferrimicrobium sp. IK TaxID=2871700 RepID=UPI0021CB6C43|nr:patatin-like phospholipase family protein [Acidiferrimicrobium sp. IK]MCU4186092.1 patatin-like phospholipase family protein [Acidiferrimicrobium sp. IK]